MKLRKLSLDHSDDTSHGNRPWVYFMIDSFFLITQFFVLTFHLHKVEPIIPEKLVGAGRPTEIVRPATQDIRVHVSRPNSLEPSYRVLAAGSSDSKTLAQFTDLLAQTAASTDVKNLRVNVSYDPAIPFGDVMGVFNACHKCGIDACNLVATR